MYDLARVCPRILLASALWILTVGAAAQSPGAQRITLAQAQAKAAATRGADLAQYAIDAAEYHRKAVQADYFPKIDSTFANLHFNKFLGQTFQLARRSAALPLFDKDQTIFIATVTQPVTPILKVREAVRIARADEVVARARAANLAAQISSNIEQTYFRLLMAQRKRTIAEENLNSISSRLQLTSTVVPTLDAVKERRTAFFKAATELETVESDVIQLTHSLNSMVGLPPETELELVGPEPVAEVVTLVEATQQSLLNSPEIVEAEQGVVKARAATRLSKLEYVPDVAVLGGYVYEIVLPALPKDFSFIGVVATWTIFDFGKRERTISEMKSQVSMAEANVDLVKTKIAASAQKAFFDFERTRKIRDITRRLTSEVAAISLDEFNPEAKAAFAQTEADMFQAELDYRAAYAQLKKIMEGR